MPVNFNDLHGIIAGDELTVRFKPEATPDLMYVFAMHDSMVLNLSPTLLRRLRNFHTSGDWGSDENRTQILTVGLDWSREFFEGRMRRAIDFLEVRRKT